MNRTAHVALFLAVLTVQGCDYFKSKPSAPSTSAAQAPRVMVQRVPCKIKFGPLAAALEVDLSELKNLVLDAKQFYNEIVTGEPGPTVPERGQPVIMVVNKKDSRITYFQLTPNIKEIRLKNKDAKEVTLIVKNQDPLAVELWLDSPNDVEVTVEFKDSLSSQK